VDDLVDLRHLFDKRRQSAKGAREV
jgi:hypothetical protein